MTNACDPLNMIVSMTFGSYFSIRMQRQCTNTTGLNHLTLSVLYAVHTTHTHTVFDMYLFYSGEYSSVNDSQHYTHSHTHNDHHRCGNYFIGNNMTCHCITISPVCYMNMTPMENQH